MYISEVRIKNYRTFEDVTFHFDSCSNYLVGDNNIGKSNFLAFLKTITHGYGFREDDFLNPREPISVFLTLAAEDIGIQETVGIELRQSIHEVVPTLLHSATNEVLPLEYMRTLFYLEYSIEEIPRNLVTADELEKAREIYKSYFSVEEHVKNIRNLLVERKISVHIPDDPEVAADMLVSLIFGRSDKPPIFGSTMQLLFAIASHLLVRLSEKKKSRAVSFDDIVVVNKEGKKYFPLIISIDEPELHLHPYLQRAVLAFLQSVLNNREPVFCQMIQYILGVDGLDGQLFVVTHSTDALVNDYRQIVRLYRNKEGKVQVACGADFHFGNEIEKHLIMHFPEMKEAFYSRCAILVEGETEYGSFPYFARTIGVNFDYHGICLINARGESSIIKIAQLIRCFHIPVVCLYDRDVMEENHTEYIFYTDYICFEMDVVKACLSNGHVKYLKDAILATGATSDFVNSSLVKKAAQKLNLDKRLYSSRKLDNISARDKKALTFYYFAWLYGNKGVITGRALGEGLLKSDIPSAFKKVIEKAVSYVEG